MVKKNSQFEEYKYIVMVVGLSILIGLALVFIVGRPLYASMKKTSADLKEKKLVLQKLESNLQTLQGLQAKEAEIKTKNDKVLAALPTDKDVSRLFVQLEKIANDAGLKIQSVSESGDTDTTTATSGTIIPISYQISGTANNYRSLKNSLNKIEEALRLVSVSNITAEGKGDLNVSLIVDTFARGE